MKKLAGHQTYFFPYLGYFTVLNQADVFVHGDSFQFIKNGWMNRNRIIGEDGKPRYITVPLKKASRETPANRMMISYNQDWRGVILDNLGYYRKRAPYYKDVVDMLKTLFSDEYQYLADLSMASVDITLKRLGIEKRIYKLSELEAMPTEDIAADEWGLYMCKCFEDEGVDTYINAPGGKAFYDEEKYRKNGLNIEFIQNNLRAYDQGRDSFVEGLSIIDVMMFNSPEEIRDMLTDYRVI